MQPRHEWLNEAVAIVDQWEETHHRRLLATTDAGKLAQLIADALELAYNRGATGLENGESTTELRP